MVVSGCSYSARGGHMTQSKEVKYTRWFDDEESEITAPERAPGVSFGDEIAEVTDGRVGTLCFRCDMKMQEKWPRKG